MATSNGSTAIRDKILASLARYRALRIGKFPCAFWRLSSRPGLTAKEVSKIQNLTVFTPIKKQKGQKYLKPQDQWLSTAISCVRQPIETLFGWIEEKTGIECAGKLRSYNGLIVYVFDKLTAAMFFWNVLRVSA